MILLFIISAINIANVSGVIGPVSAEYLIGAIEKAESESADCLIIKLDTPGGLDESMREIIKKMLNAKIPIIVYVHPSGGRCASAGVFITYAAHIAAMTPGTNIGAAHPVAMGGKMDEEMKAKVTNDAAIYIKSIAEKRKRNKEWAEKAVRKSVSVTEKEALKLGVIDIVADNITELIEKLDGKEVEILSEKITIHTKDKEQKEIPWTTRQNILEKLSNPNIAYILLMLGIYGLIAEFSHPGAIFPGVFGAVSLVLAFFSFQILPVNYAGLILILLGITLFIFEVLTPTYGPLAAGGIISMFLGSVMLFKPGAPFFQISIPLIITVTACTAAFFIFALGMAFKIWRKKPTTGKKGLIAEIGKVRGKIKGEEEGAVFVHGEIWKAIADETIEKGVKVKVVDVDGLMLKVERIKKKMTKSE